MEYEFDGNTLKIDKELSDLDNFVIEFVKLLDKCNIKYVIISGYPAIFFGRSRATEDVDMFIEKIPKEKFLELWEASKKDFDCIITSDPDDAYNYLAENMAIRFAGKGFFEPNMEIKFADDETDFYSMKNLIEVKCSGSVIKMSPFEMNIAYKLFMGSEKDIEDAKHLYKVLKEIINKNELNVLFLKLRVKKEIISKLGD
ncbi:MAG: hypothetical protein HY513_04825 [Candidatus Aenigmarchaeota archaeon]|nr:hypothetical protein [Candidatus Aenigmarchaeota archaeon]